MWTQILKTLAIKNKYNRGFSIVELVVVMSIITVLTTASSIGYKSYQSKARLVTARSNLGSIMQIAKAYKGTKGYFLPNLQAMGIQLKGLLEHSYTIRCQDSNGAVVESGLCGEFNYPNPDSTVESDACGSGANVCTGKCWYGYVMAHALNCNSTYTNPGNPDVTPVVPASVVPCKGDATDSELFTSQGIYGGVPSIPDLCQQVRGSGAVIDPENEVALTGVTTDDSNPLKGKGLFTLHDGDSICENRVSGQDLNGNNIDGRVDDASALRSTTKSCAFSKKYTMLDVSSVYTNNPDIAGASGPNTLILIAIGCQNKEDDCDASDKYQIMTLDSRTNMYVERLDL